MMFVEPPGVISEGKLAAVIIFTLLAGMIIGIFIGFLIWRAHLIPSPLALIDQAKVNFLASMALQ